MIYVQSITKPDPWELRFVSTDGAFVSLRVCESVLTEGGMIDPSKLLGSEVEVTEFVSFSNDPLITG